jgi:hypothetical protein
MGRLDSLSPASVSAKSRGQSIAAGRTYQTAAKFGTPGETNWRIFVPLRLIPVKRGTATADTQLAEINTAAPITARFLIAQKL